MRTKARAGMDYRDAFRFVFRRRVQFPVSERDHGHRATASPVREPRGLSVFLRVRQR